MSEAAAGRIEEKDKRELLSGFSFLVQVSRPGLWSTTAMFYLMPLGHWTAFRSPAFWVGLFYVLFPLGLILYGVNDIADADADRFNPRKGTYLFGSLGAGEQWAVAAVVGFVLMQVPFLILFFFLVGPRTLLWLIVLWASWRFNVPRFGWKGVPPLDVLIQSSYLLVFVLSSWLNGVPQLPWPTFVFGALFAMHSHVFGEVMDIAPDRLIGRRTTATAIGAVRAKWLIAAILCVEMVLLRQFFHAGLVAIFLRWACWFVIDATFLWKNRAYRPLEMRVFMWAWNLASLAAIYWDWWSAALTHAKACRNRHRSTLASVNLLQTFRVPASSQFAAGLAVLADPGSRLSGCSPVKNSKVCGYGIVTAVLAGLFALTPTASAQQHSSNWNDCVTLECAAAEPPSYWFDPAPNTAESSPTAPRPPLPATNSNYVREGVWRKLPANFVHDQRISGCPP